MFLKESRYYNEIKFPGDSRSFTVTLKLNEFQEICPLWTSLLMALLRQFEVFLYIFKHVSSTLFLCKHFLLLQ